MPSVYHPENFSGRVNLAAKYIIEQRRPTRSFDTCFEMFDGDVVACALYRRAIGNPQLAANLPKYLDTSLREETMGKYANISTRALSLMARKQREIKEGQ